VYVKVLINLRLGFQKLTTTGEINTEEEDDKPCPVTAATANIAVASLAVLAGEDKLPTSLDLEGRMSSKRGAGGFGIGSERATPIYGGEILRAVTHRFSPFSASSRHLPSVSLRERNVLTFCRDEGGSLETADSSVPPVPGLDGALRTMLCNNTR
jgi:hypothetical protein